MVPMKLECRGVLVEWGVRVFGVCGEYYGDSKGDKGKGRHLNSLQTNVTANTTYTLDKQLLTTNPTTIIMDQKTKTAQ